MWKLENYPSISPYLISDRAEELLAFLANAFDGVVLRRFDRPDGSLMHAEIRIDDSIVMVGGGAAGAQPVATHIHFYVKDALAMFNRAVQAGGIVVQEPCRKRADDDLRGGVIDPSGTTWWIATA
jgi:PhnB protein